MRSKNGATGKCKWPQVRLGEVCEIKYGKAHNSLSSGSIPVYGSGGIIRYVDSFLYSKESVLIPRKGTLENLFFIVKPFWTSDTMFYTQIYENKIMPEFLYYQLFTLNLADMNVGTAVPSLTTAVLNELEISLPPLPTQRAIAATLSCFDDKIALNHRINANLEAQVQAIFKSWFVDFDPFKGGKFVDSELGRIPKGWKMGLFSDLVNVKYGKAHQSLGDGIFPVYGSGGLMRYAEKYLYNKESVLIPRKGTLDNVMYVKEPFWTVDTMFYTEMKRPHISPFVYQFVKQKNLSSMNVGTAVPSMTTEILNALLTIVPPDGILCDYDKIASILYDQMRLNAKQSRTLAAIRDALLPKLMSGEIEVKL
jgi:type I restriction enzyme S subunit